MILKDGNSGMNISRSQTERPNVPLSNKN